MHRRTLFELAEISGAELEGDGRRVVTGPASLREAGPEHVSLYTSSRYRDELLSTRAAAVVAPKDLEVPRGDLTLLRCGEPNRAFTRIVVCFAEESAPPAPGVHPSSVVHPSAVLGEGVSVGPLCFVGPGAVLGARAELRALVSLGSGVRVGEASVLHPMVVVYDGVTIGARCLIHGGTVLGSDGYGFEPAAEGWEKIPQCGTVAIEDEVEIGANCTVDRGRFGATRIGRGAKLDNLVHVGHNVVVGEHALLVAQVGISGSSEIGRHAILAGQVGIAGHLRIGEGARIGSKSAVHRDVPAGEDWHGNPARPGREALRNAAQLGRLPRILERVGELERRLARLEGSLENGALPTAGAAPEERRP